MPENCNEYGTETAHSCLCHNLTHTICYYYCFFFLVFDRISFGFVFSHYFVCFFFFFAALVCLVNRYAENCIWIQLNPYNNIYYQLKQFWIAEEKQQKCPQEQKPIFNCQRLCVCVSDSTTDHQCSLKSHRNWRNNFALLRQQLKCMVIVDICPPKNNVPLWYSCVTMRKGTAAQSFSVEWAPNSIQFNWCAVADRSQH